MRAAGANFKIVRVEAGGRSGLPGPHPIWSAHMCRWEKQHVYCTVAQNAMFNAVVTFWIMQQSSQNSIRTLRQ